VYRLPRRHVLGGFSIGLHPLRHWQVRSRHSFRLHQLRGGHVLGIDWSLNLPFLLGWVLFLIQQLHAVRGGQVFRFFGGECVHQLRGGHVLGIDWSLNVQFMFCWVDLLLRFIEQLHAVRSGQVFAFFGSECMHRVRSRHVLGIDWSLNLPFLLGWVVFVIRFIEQLHAVRSWQVLYDIRGNVGLNMLQLPRLCKLAVRQRLGGRLFVQRRLVGPQRRHVCAVHGGQVH
jgi:hypothetical protein